MMGKTIRAYSLRDNRRLAMAADIANAWGGAIEDWMLWKGWETWVGCERCVEGGPLAVCWGMPSCHGYEWGCGCIDCAKQEKQEAED